MEQEFEGETRLRVRYEETDRMGVVYHAKHLVYWEVSRTALMKSKGIRYADLALLPRDGRQPHR